MTAEQGEAKERARILRKVGMIGTAIASQLLAGAGSRRASDLHATLDAMVEAGSLVRGDRINPRGASCHTYTLPKGK